MDKLTLVSKFFPIAAAMCLLIPSSTLAQKPINSSAGKCSGNSVSGQNNYQLNNCSIIQVTPNPAFQTMSVEEYENKDGTHSVKLLGQVIAQFSPGKMTVHVAARGLKAVSIIPNDGAGMIALWNEMWNDTQYQATINGPSGQYYIVVTTKMKTQIQLATVF